MYRRIHETTEDWKMRQTQPLSSDGKCCCFPEYSVYQRRHNNGATFLTALSRLHEYKEGTPLEKTFFLEMWDIGGSVGSASSIKSTRSLFYNGVNGIILVHDLTNKKSCQNLRGWIAEVLNRESAPTGVLVTNGDAAERERLADSQTPLLMVGTKLDQVPEAHRSALLSRVTFFAEDLAANEMILDCTNPRYLAAGSSNAVKLSRFFDKVIERRYFVKETSVLGTERWRASYAYKAAAR
uniref:rab-like protein 3 isoform X2 n=1 Tax=Myxine glutinosa TaxID=7769 RepID=UPI00358FE604